jgi:putative phosphoesterase
MRYAVLSDIHANLAALDAVLEEVRSEDIKTLILLGDYVGYYYEPGAVVDRLREWPHLAVRGNHDRLLLEARTSESVRDDYRARYGTGIDVALEELGAEAMNWLAGLPERLGVDLGPHKVELCHGAHFDPDFYVYPNSSRDIFERSALAGRDAVWMGHTHWPFLRPGKPWLLNPGSVGQPRDLGSVASWCIFDADRGSIAFRRSEFDPSGPESEALARDPGLTRNREVFRRGRLGAER